MKYKLRTLLADLKAFAIELANAPAQPQAAPFVPSTMFYHRDHGYMGLSGDEAARYSKIIAGLLSNMDKAISEASISNLVQTAIFKTIDIRKLDQAQSVNARADKAVDEVRRALSSPHLKWISCIPIVGLKPPKKAWRLGDVVLVDIAGKEGNAFLKDAEHITDRTTNTDEEKAFAKAETRRQLISDHAGQAFALVSANALDAEAAFASSKRRLRFTLDCLNFAINYLHGNKELHELTDAEPRKRHYASAVTMNVTDHKSIRVDGDLSKGAMELEADSLIKDIRKNLALRRLCDYLQQAKPTGHQNRVLSAIQWAGRAAVEWRAEEAFLLRAIALESLILGYKDTELTNRLALSIVHLLGSWLRDRKVGAVQVKALYGLRSAIVHSGKYEVKQEDAAIMRKYVLSCFRRVLEEKRFIQMIAKGDLDDWFDARMRGDK